VKLFTHIRSYNSFNRYDYLVFFI